MIGTQELADRHGVIVLRWYREVALVLGYYALYTMVRNHFGSATVSPAVALTNARRVIGLERTLGLYFEPSLQNGLLPWTSLLRACNIFYGSLHFIVTGGVMVWLYRVHPERYRYWRRVLVATITLALIGFMAFPLMPPRLLSDGGIFGGGAGEFHFVDTLAQVGGLWSFGSEGMKSISNQYAAMPSLHIGWSCWCVLAAAPVTRSAAARAAFLLYPLLTLFTIIVTANHYWIDGVGGLVALAGGCTVAELLQRHSVTTR